MVAFEGGQAFDEVGRFVRRAWDGGNGAAAVTSAKRSATWQPVTEKQHVRRAPRLSPLPLPQLGSRDMPIDLDAESGSEQDFKRDAPIVRNDWVYEARLQRTTPFMMTD